MASFLYGHLPFTRWSMRSLQQSNFWALTEEPSGSSMAGAYYMYCIRKRSTTYFILKLQHIISYHGYSHNAFLTLNYFILLRNIIVNEINFCWTAYFGYMKWWLKSITSRNKSTIYVVLILLSRSNYLHWFDPIIVTLYFMDLFCELFLYAYLVK